MVSCEQCLHKNVCKMVDKHGKIDKLLCSHYTEFTGVPVDPDKKLCVYTYDEARGLCSRCERENETKQVSALHDKMDLFFKDLHWLDNTLKDLIVMAGKPYKED